MIVPKRKRWKFAGTDAKERAEATVKSLLDSKGYYDPIYFKEQSQDASYVWIVEVLILDNG